MVEVRFEAKNTNSAQPAPKEPLPKPKSHLYEWLIIFYTFPGVVLMLWPMPAGIILGALAAVAAYSIDGPRIINKICLIVSIIATIFVSWGIVYKLPLIQKNYSHYYVNEASIGSCTSYSYPDPYTRSQCRKQAAASIQARRYADEAEPRERQNELRLNDETQRILLFVALFVAFATLHGIAARESLFPVEAPSTPLPLLPLKEPDPDAKIKRDGFNRWIVERITISSGPETLPVETAFDNYKTYLKETQFVMPPSYDLSGFRASMKATQNKEPVDKGGVMVYQGVSLKGVGLI